MTIGRKGVDDEVDLIFPRHKERENNNKKRKRKHEDETAVATRTQQVEEKIWALGEDKILGVPPR